MVTREDLRDKAKRFFEAAIKAADPYEIVKRAIRFDAESKEWKIKIGSNNSEKSYPQNQCFHVVALGKAAVGMAEATVNELGKSRVSSTLVVTHEDYRSANIPNENILKAAHPFPDESSVKAGNALLDKFRSVKEGEVILFLLSGGGSALATVPTNDIELQDKIDITELLFKAGADITQLNCIRKHLSKIKGGQLAQATKATIHTIILSDVVFNQPADIASGMTYPDGTTLQNMRDIIKKYNLQDDIPERIKQRLENAKRRIIEDTPDDTNLFKHVTWYIAGSNGQSVKAARDMSASIMDPYNIDLYIQPITGEASNAATSIGGTIRNSSILHIRGGETTVTIKGDGKGGRNQEFALAYALFMERAKAGGTWVFLSGGTDGRDGPTEAAGGIVDNQSLQRMREANIDPQKELDNNNSYYALKASDDLIPRDDTGTNVGDIQIFIGFPYQ